MYDICIAFHWLSLHSKLRHLNANLRHRSLEKLSIGSPDLSNASPSPERSDYAKSSPERGRERMSARVGSSLQCLRYYSSVIYISYFSDPHKYCTSNQSILILFSVAFDEINVQKRHKF